MVSFLTLLKKARTLDVIWIQKLPPDINPNGFHRIIISFRTSSQKTVFSQGANKPGSLAQLNGGMDLLFPELSPDFAIIRWNIFRVTLALFKQVPYGFHSFQISSLPYSGTAIEPVSEKAVMQS